MKVHQVVVIPGIKSILADYRFKIGKDLPVIIFCHGYKGYKDWGAWNLVADRFAENGFFVLKFNFSHNGGTIENPIDFPDLAAFGQNNYSKEVNDLNTVINWLAFQDFPINHSSINLIGHSRGGGIVLLNGLKNQKVNRVVTWAGVSDYDSRFPKGETMAKWKKDGVMYVQNGRTKQDMPHNIQFYEDFIDNESKLDIKKACLESDKKVLIIHGTNDQAVSIEEGMNLNTWLESSFLVTIKNGNHTFSSKHPWEEHSLPNDLQQVVSETTSWLLSK